MNQSESLLEFSYLSLYALHQQIKCIQLRVLGTLYMFFHDWVIFAIHRFKMETWDLSSK